MHGNMNVKFMNAKIFVGVSVTKMRDMKVIYRGDNDFVLKTPEYSNHNFELF